MRPYLAVPLVIVALGCGENQLPTAPAGSDAGQAKDGSIVDASEPEDAGQSEDAGSIDDAGEADAGEPDAGEDDAGQPDAGATCHRIVPTSQPLDWGDCYSTDWPVYTGGMTRVLATYFSGMSSGAAEWTDASDRDYYVALPMSWVLLGRNQADYNQTAYSLITSSCSTSNYCDPPRTNIPPRLWGQEFCVVSLTTGRELVARLVDTGPADRLRTHLVEAYGAQTWIDLSPGAAAYLATGDRNGTPDNQIVTFWEGACE